MVQLSKVLAYSVLAGSAIAHPGADVRKEARERAVHLNHPERRTLSDCHQELEASGYYKREIERRAAHAAKLREQLGIEPGTKLRNVTSRKLVANGSFCRPWIHSWP